MPNVDSIAEFNQLLIAADAMDERRRIENRSTRVGHNFDFERETLRPNAVGAIHCVVVADPGV